MGEHLEAETPKAEPATGGWPWARTLLAFYWTFQAIPLAAYLATSAVSTEEKWVDTNFWVLFYVGSFACLLPPLAAIPVLFVAARSKPRCMWKWALAWSLLLSVPLWYGAGRMGSSFRTRDFAALAERMEPLVAAILAYEKQHGAPPPNLDALVPEFIPAIPPTGMSAYPTMKYLVGKDADHWFGNPWALHMDTSEGVLDWDYFYYLPLQNYPPTQPDGTPQRIGEWVYLHE